MKVQSQKDAIEAQKQLYNEKIKRAADSAYGEGVHQRIYYQKRIGFALQFLPANATVLDLGCGDGTIARAIAERANKVVALDVSEAAIKLARQKNPAPNIQYICSPIEEYPEENEFDEVTMFEVLEHVFDPDAILEKITRLLRPGGFLVFSTPNRARLDPYLLKCYCRLKGRTYQYEQDQDHVREYSYHELRGLLSKHQFRIRKIDALYLSMKIASKFPQSLGWQTLLASTGRIAPRWAHHLYFAAVKPT